MVGSQWYFDGTRLRAHAAELCDPSLNWLDLRQLAAGLDPLPSGATNACYFGLQDEDQRELSHTLGIYATALRATGVDCRLSQASCDSVECLRCGHGWEAHLDHALDAEILAAVIGDALDGRKMTAFVLASPSVVSSLAALARTRLPQLTVVPVTLGYQDRGRTSPASIEIGLEQLRAARFGRTVLLPEGTRLMRPRCWSPRPAARPMTPVAADRWS